MVQVDKMTSTFNLTQEFQINEGIYLQKYISETGLTVILAQMKGPISHAYIIIRESWIKEQILGI